jgi:hypothetical protein
MQIYHEKLMMTPTPTQQSIPEGLETRPQPTRVYPAVVAGLYTHASSPRLDVDKLTKNSQESPLW